jgi:hypothetical protein
MQQPDLGHIVRVDPREVFKHEALVLTPWLRENITELAEALGLDLDMESEVSVGPFAVDLAGKDLGSGRVVIVENQLEQTDHGHLGQLLAYASGLDAAVVVWVSPRFRDEHRQALDWLNAHTDEKVDFFGVELELLRIGDSSPAPNFKLVAQPNEWAKQTKQTGAAGAPSERALRYRGFFERVLTEFKVRRPGATNAARVSPSSWFLFSAGRTGFGFSWSFTSGGRFRCELYIDTGNRDVNKSSFDALQSRSEEIQSQFGESLSWERLDNRSASRVAVYHDVPNTPPIDENAELQEWAVATMVHLNDVLRPIVKGL